MEFRCRLGTPGGEIIEGRVRRRERGAAQARVRGKGSLSSSGCIAPAAGVSPALALPRRARIADARVRGLQPGARDAAQSGHAARPVPRHPAAPGDQSGLQGGSRRRERAGARGELAVGGVRGARRAFPWRLYRLSPRRREERQPRAGDQAIRLIREGCRQRQAEDDVRARVPGDPAGPVDGGGVHHHAAGRARFRRVLLPVRSGAAALHAGHRSDRRRSPRATSFRY